jgi:hypothetical protein
MTVSEFQKLCEDIAYESADENYESAEALRGIAASVSNVVIDFTYETDSEDWNTLDNYCERHPDFLPIQTA